MPKQFFNIPLPNHDGLVELQAYLKKELTGATFQEPSTFHITLVHVEDAGDKDLSGIEIPYLPIFGVGGERIRVFSTLDGYAVTLSIEKVPQLVHLQTLLFNQMRAMGLDVSSYSWPGLYKPHVTLARTLIEPAFLDIPAMVHFQVDRFVLTGEGVNQDGSYEEIASFPLAQTTAAGEAVQEMAAIRDSMVLSEFRGSQPMVKVFPDVDIAALTQGDEDPDGGFVTLKIGKDNATSRNKRFYSADFVKELEKWVHRLRPIGVQGHMKDADRDSEYPSPKIYWIGTAKVGDTLWGKGYVPVGETRDMIKRLRATNGQIATSIYGNAQMTWDAQRGVWNVSSDLSGLEQIDLAPPTRAGIPELAVVPQLSKEITEMTGADEVPETENEETMDKLTVIQELTAADVKLLPEVVVEAIRTPAVAAEQKRIAEFATTLKVEPDAVAQRIGELLAVAEKYEAVQKQQIEHLIVTTVAETVCTDAKLTDGVKTVREMVVELVKAGQPADAAAVKEAVSKIAETDRIKGLIQLTVVSEMGGNLRRTVKPTAQTETGKSKYLKERPVAEVAS